MNGLRIYGLRDAKKLIAEMRKELARDYPRSTDPFVRGERYALQEMADRIEEIIKEIANEP